MTLSVNQDNPLISQEEIQRIHELVFELDLVDDGSAVVSGRRKCDPAYAFGFHMFDDRVTYEQWVAFINEMRQRIEHQCILAVASVRLTRIPWATFGQTPESISKLKIYDTMGWIDQEVIAGQPKSASPFDAVSEAVGMLGTAQIEDRMGQLDLFATDYVLRTIFGDDLVLDEKEGEAA